VQGVADPGLIGTVVNASRTRFYPYQFKPLLKFLDSPKQRMLIADEVDLGKVIEAGMILTGLKARQTVQRVLVVCPANLTEKRKMEMKKRFGEEFEIMNIKQSGSSSRNMRTRLIVCPLMALFR